MPRLVSFPNGLALALAAAADWLSLLEKSSGPFLTALSGGRIARDFFTAVTKVAGKSGAPLRDVHFFWADERSCRPAIPPAISGWPMKICCGPWAFPLRESTGSRESCSRPPSRGSRRRTPRLAPNGALGMPILDIVFLGLGEDGHTASLMPNAPASVLQSREPWVHVANSPKPPPNRLTLTYPMLAAAREVWTLVSGTDKETALRESLRPGGTTPFARVLRERAETRVYTDLTGIEGLGFVPCQRD